MSSLDTKVLLRKIKLFVRDPWKFCKIICEKAYRFFQPMRKNYRKKFKMTLKQWLLYHQGNIVFSDPDLEWLVEPGGRTCLTIKQRGRGHSLLSVVLSPLDTRQWALEVEVVNWLDIMPKHIGMMRSLVSAVGERIQTDTLSKILEELTRER